jgi:hypothetical protein
MNSERISDSANPVEPPTLEELRIKLAQYAFDAQRAELQRQIRRLADAAAEQAKDSA